MIKKLASRYLPKTIIVFHIIFGFFTDGKRFLKNAMSVKTDWNQRKLNALIIRQSHGVEKGLSLPNPEKNRGLETVTALIKNTKIYYKNFGFDSTLAIALDNLHGYKAFNKNSSIDSIKKIIINIVNLSNEIKEYDLNNRIQIGGWKNYSKNDWEKNNAEFNFKKFVSSRVSIRNFSDKEVDIKDINKSIEVAMKSPSHCNRQPWKVRIFKGKRKDYILKFQYGNKGFSRSINTVLLVTGLVSSFTHKERTAAWIDGGLFSMSLMYALLDNQIGSCPLNTQYTVFQDNKLRKTVKLDDDEVPIMMIGLGHVKDNFIIANSPRKSLDEVIISDE